MLNAQFFAALRAGLYHDGLSQGAVDGMNAVCKAFDGFTGHDHCTDDLAYILATVYRETGPDMRLNIVEVGRGAGKAYGEKVPPYNVAYYGRGPCQITWLANYQRAKLRMGADFVQFPDLMCDPTYGVAYMIDGMYAGIFTGKGLRTYITPGKPTTLAAFTECRRIINGTDHAAEVAATAVLFQRALYNGYDKPLSVPAAPLSKQSATPPKRGLVAEVLRLFGKGA